MKIRTDFVTNSSSSSFVCFGVNKESIKNSKQLYLNMFEEYVKTNANKPWSKLTISKANSMNEYQKIEYVKNHLNINLDEEDEDDFENDLISRGGEEYDEVGITMYTLMKEFPDLKLKEIKSKVAEELNKKFKTNFTEKDISYFESGWYNG